MSDADMVAANRDVHGRGHRPGQSFKVVKVDASANAVTEKTSVVEQAMGTGAGTVGVSLATKGASLLVTSDGTQFW